MSFCEAKTPVSTWLITGCSRGIGLELVRQISARLAPDDILIATCRSPDSASDLKAVAKVSKPQTHILQLDITDEESVNRAVHDTQAIVGERGIDYLLSNAAIINDDDLSRFNVEECMSIFKTCVVGPTLIATHFTPLVLKSKEKIFVNFSSNLGSVTIAWSDMRLSYSMAKAAVNMLSTKMQKAHPTLKVVNLHPGWVKTQLGGPDAQIEPFESVEGILKLLQDIADGTKIATGTFWSYDGTTLPW